MAGQVDEYKVIEDLINADSYDPLVRPASLFGECSFFIVCLFIVSYILFYIYDVCIIFFFFHLFVILFVMFLILLLI